MNSTPNSCRFSSTNATITSMGGRVPPRKSRGPLQQIVGPPQLTVVLLELPDPLGLRRGQARLHAVIDVGLLDPGPQRLDPAADLVGDPPDRPVRGAELLAQLPHQPDRPGLLLWRVPTRRRLPRRALVPHGSILVSKVRSLQATQGGSGPVAAACRRRGSTRS